MKKTNLVLAHTGLRIFFTLILVLASTFVVRMARAEECLMIKREQRIKTPSGVMPGMNPSTMRMMSPAMQKMMKDNAEKSAKNAEPKMITEYLTASQRIEINPDTWILTDYEKMEIHYVDPRAKSVRTMSMAKIIAPFGDMTKMAKAASSQVQKTGVSQKVAGIPCDEYMMKIGENKMKGNKHVPAFSSKTTETRCISTTQPPSYFKFTKGYETKFLKKLPADRQQQILAERKAVEGNPYFQGFELQSTMKMNETEVQKTGNAAMDAKLQAAMDSSSSASRKIVLAVSKECPPKQYVSVPADYKNFEVGRKNAN